MKLTINSNEKRGIFVHIKELIFYKPHTTRHFNELRVNYRRTQEHWGLLERLTVICIWLWNLTVHYHNSESLDPVLSQFNPRLLSWCDASEFVRDAKVSEASIVNLHLSYPVDESRKFIRNGDICILNYTASHLTTAGTTNLTADFSHLPFIWLRFVSIRNRSVFQMVSYPSGFCLYCSTSLLFSRACYMFSPHHHP